MNSALENERILQRQGTDGNNGDDGDGDDSDDGDGNDGDGDDRNNDDGDVESIGELEQYDFRDIIDDEMGDNMFEKSGYEDEEGGGNMKTMKVAEMREVTKIKVKRWLIKETIKVTKMMRMVILTT